jgi:UDP-galactopyranose mutase
LFGLNIRTEEEMKDWLKTVQIPCDPVVGCQNAEEMAKSRVGEALYKAIFETYTIKQWNKSPKELNASVTARIPVRSDFDPRYFADKWQALPGEGYTAWFEAMFDHPLIDVVLNTDFFDHKKHLEGPACKSIVYTGPIDRYFEAQGLERLEYRSIIFTEERHFNTPGYILPSPVVNYPGPETPYTRAIEYKHYLHRDSPHSVVVKETTSDEGEPYYPIPDPRNIALYEKYKEMADRLERNGKFIFVGRLANYKYFDMDKAINNALELFDRSAWTKLQKNNSADS